MLAEHPDFIESKIGKNNESDGNHENHIKIILKT